MLIEADFPEGNRYLAEYNGPYNSLSKQTIVPKTGSPLPSKSVIYAYPTSCAGVQTRQNCVKPVSVTDANGNRTDLTYAADGDILSEMSPPPSSGGARPLKLYTYLQMAAYVKNGAGALVSTGQPIWLPATLSVCQTVAGSSSPVCDGSAPQTVTTYQYGADGTADNLLVRGIAVASGGATQRTCYSYDSLSRKISQTLPLANLAVCS